MGTHKKSELLRPLGQWIVDKRIQDSAQTVLVAPQELHGYLRCDPVCAFNPCDTKAVDNILRQAERHAFGRC